MAILSTLADLFKAGASFAAEQFVRGRSNFSTLADLLRRNYGGNLQADQATIGELQHRVSQASIPALALQSGAEIVRSSIPTWESDNPQPGIVHSGIAKLSEVASTGELVFSTWLPFNFHEIEIMHLEDIIGRIRGAINNRDNSVGDRYTADIDRLQNLIRFHEIVGGRQDVEPEVYGLYQGGMLG